MNVYEIKYNDFGKAVVVATTFDHAIKAFKKYWDKEKVGTLKIKSVEMLDVFDVVVGK